MANNVLLKKDVDLNLLNENYGDDFYELSIRVKNQKTKKNTTFKKVDVLMNLPVYKDVTDENTGLTTKTYIGTFNRWVGLHFRKDAWKDAFVGCSAKSIEDLSTGRLYVRKKDVKAPNEFYIQPKKEEDFTEEERKQFEESGIIPVIFPSCWIHGGIGGFIPYVKDDSFFTYNGQVKEDADEDGISLE